MKAGALAAAEVGAALPTGLGLLALSESGVPVPIPTDLVVLFLGERAQAGTFPLWWAVLLVEVIAVAGTAALFFASRGPARALVTRFGPRLGVTEARLRRLEALLSRRGRPALALGRSTPGLRTMTVVAAGGSAIKPAEALPPLVLGSTVFLQGHLVIGLLLGPLARTALERAKGPAVVGIVALVAVAAVVWVVRRGRRSGAQAWTEAACPACLVVGVVGSRTDEGATQRR